jgi:hypothetical protein
MKFVALICNIVLFAFTCFVLLVEGPPVTSIYVVFTLWALSTLMLSAVVMARSGAGALRTVAIVANVVFVAFVCWAIVDQYPHPEEDGVIAMAVSMVLTPLLSLAVLARRVTPFASAGAGERG